MKESRFGLPPAARSIVDVLALDREAFLQTAYIAVLGRRPDPEGMSHYLTQMRTGVSKEDVVFALATSPEGLRTQRDVAGLDALLRSVQRRRSSLTRRVLGRIGRALIGDLVGDSLRAQEWAQADRLADQNRQLKQQIEHLEARLHASIDARLDRVEHRMAHFERPEGHAQIDDAAVDRVRARLEAS